MKKLFSAMATALGLAMAVPASAVVVGGIDFGALGADPSRTHLDTATLAQTFVNGNGQNSTAYGYITSVNGDNHYCVGNGDCGLFYVARFNDSQNYNGSYVEFLSSTVTVYFSSTAVDVNLLDSSSAVNLAMIGSMTPWVTLVGHGNLGGIADPDAVLTGSGTLTGSTLSGSGYGLLDVDLSGPGLAEVMQFLDANGVPDAVGGLADIAFTSSFNNYILNPKDIANGSTAGCKTGQAGEGAWCYQGTSNLRGDTSVPEPGLLGLLAIGLIGLGARTRARGA